MFNSLLFQYLVVVSYLNILSQRLVLMSYLNILFSIFELFLIIDFQNMVLLKGFRSNVLKPCFDKGC